MPFVTRNGVRIHYEVDGRGPAVVCAPGLGGSLEVVDCTEWPAAFRGYRRISVDPRGHGSSGKPSDVAAHRVEEYGEDLRAVADAEHLDRAVYLGISDGSEMIAAFATAHPERVAALIDVDGWDDRDPCEDPVRQGRLDMAKEVRVRGWDSLVSGLAASLGVSGEAPYVREFRKGDTEMAALELEAWTTWKGPVSLLPRLRMPILRFLNGKREASEIARIRAGNPANVELHVIPDEGHWRLCFEPELTIDRILNFLARVTREGLAAH